MNPINAIGVIIHFKDGKEYFVGTSFSFKEAGYFLTANHCIPENLDSIAIVLPYLKKTLTATAVARHETADVAILHCDNSKNDLENIETFKLVDIDHLLGKDYITYGYPEDMLGPGKGMPTPRLFKGYIQRWLNHKSYLGYEYKAAELSTACPKGLSGSPLFSPNNFEVVYGLVAENIEVSTERWVEEEESTENSRKQFSYNRVITIGVAVVLDRFIDWINEHIPKS